MIFINFTGNAGTLTKNSKKVYFFLMGPFLNRRMINGNPDKKQFQKTDNCYSWP